MAEKVLPMTTSSSQPSDVTGILKQSIKLSTINGKLMVSIILLLLLPFSLLLLLHHIFLSPLMEELENQEPQSNLSKDAKILLGLELIFLFGFSILSLFGIISTIYYSSITYTGKSVTLKEVLLRIKSTWKKPVITWLYILILTIGYISFVTVVISAFALITKVGSMALWIGLLLGGLAAVFYLYLSAVWMLSLVISVLNEDCYGLKAIEKAGEAIRGRKVQGFVLMLFLFLLTGPITGLFYLNVTDDDLGLIVRFALGTVVTVIFCVAKLFTFVVFTVFYFECKKNHGEKVEMEMRIGTGYNLVPNSLLVNNPSVP